MYVIKQLNLVKFVIDAKNVFEHTIFTIQCTMYVHCTDTIPINIHAIKFYPNVSEAQRESLHN